MNENSIQVILTGTVVAVDVDHIPEAIILHYSDGRAVAIYASEGELRLVEDNLPRA